MTVVSWLELLTNPALALPESFLRDGTALTIGGFDGPHRGHQELFSAVLAESGAKNLRSGVVTFVRSPRHVKSSHNYSGDVSTVALRLEYLESIGMELVLLIDFSGDFGRMSGGVFLEILVKTVRMKYLAVGPDFRCGHRLDTGTAELTALSRRDGFRFDSIRQIDLDGNRISSSQIRDAVLSADFTLAEALLGRPFLLDIRPVDWTVNGPVLETKTEYFDQILPCQGSYRVLLTVQDGYRLPARLSIDSAQVRIEPLDSRPLPSVHTLTTAQFGLS